jgi:hypothetical protein
MRSFCTLAPHEEFLLLSPHPRAPKLTHHAAVARHAPSPEKQCWSAPAGTEAPPRAPPCTPCARGPGRGAVRPAAYAAPPAFCPRHHVWPPARRLSARRTARPARRANCAPGARPRPPRRATPQQGAPRARRRASASPSRAYIAQPLFPPRGRRRAAAPQTQVDPASALCPVHPRQGGGEPFPKHRAFDVHQPPRNRNRAPAIAGAAPHTTGEPPSRDHCNPEAIL